MQRRGHRWHAQVFRGQGTAVTLSVQGHGCAIRAKEGWLCWQPKSQPADPRVSQMALGAPISHSASALTHLIVLGDGLVGAPHGPEGLGFLPQCMLHVPALGLMGGRRGRQGGRLGLQARQGGWHIYDRSSTSTEVWLNHNYRPGSVHTLQGIAGNVSQTLNLTFTA